MVHQLPRQPAQLCQRWTGGSTGRRSRPRAVSPTRSSGCARRCRLQIAASSAQQRGTTAPAPGVRPQHAPTRAVHLGLVCIQLSRRAESGLFAPMSKARMHVASCALLFRFKSGLCSSGFHPFGAASWRRLRARRSVRCARSRTAHYAAAPHTPSSGDGRHSVASLRSFERDSSQRTLRAPARGGAGLWWPAGRRGDAGRWSAAVCACSSS